MLSPHLVLGMHMQECSRFASPSTASTIPTAWMVSLAPGLVVFVCSPCLVSGQSLDNAPDGILAASEVGLDGPPHRSGYPPGGVHHLESPHSRHVLLYDVCGCRT